MEPTRDLVVGTAGHIDHGKTALVRALSGVDTDRLPDEKRRGISIDLGFAALELGGRQVALVDVPGHERFLRNMLAGASGLDLALLVVAADDSVMPQTREHLEVLRLLGLGGGVIALSKCDLAAPDWIEMVEDDIRRLVGGTFLEGAPIVRTSAATGLGIAELSDALRASCETAEARRDLGRFRMEIDRAFHVEGRGAVVTGTVAAGSVAVGDALELWPGGRAVRVRGLHRHDQPVDRVGRGARAAINLAGVRTQEVGRGSSLAEPGYLEASNVLTVEVAPSHEAPAPLKHRGRYALHIGTAEVAASLSLFEPVGSDGTVSLGQLVLAEPIAAVGGQPFVIRRPSPPATIGGGRVLQPVARRLRRRDRAAWERSRRLGDPDPVVRVEAALNLDGLKSWTAATLGRDASATPDEVEIALESLRNAGRLDALRVGHGRLVEFPSGLVAELEDRILRALGRLHAARPRHSAVRLSWLDAELPDLAARGLLEPLLGRLQDAGKIAADERSVALSEHKPTLTQAERRLKDDISDALRDEPFTPPDESELRMMAGPRSSTVPELLALLADEGLAVSIGPGLWLDSEAESEMRRRLEDALSDGRGLAMSGLRDLLGTTRKYAVPIGEYLDRAGLTRREGDLRYRAASTNE